jgi:hypothetical protein
MQFEMNEKRNGSCIINGSASPIHRCFRDCGYNGESVSGVKLLDILDTNMEIAVTAKAAAQNGFKGEKAGGDNRRETKIAEQNPRWISTLKQLHGEF